MVAAIPWGMGTPAVATNASRLRHPIHASIACTLGPMLGGLCNLEACCFWVIGSKRLDMWPPNEGRAPRGPVLKGRARARGKGMCPLGDGHGEWISSVHAPLWSDNTLLHTI